MRKFLALIMVALLALTLALTVVGCGGQSTETAPPPAETAAPMSEMPMDTTMAAPEDTAMGGH